jgi:hypothetical protein
MERGPSETRSGWFVGICRPGYSQGKNNLGAAERNEPFSLQAINKRFAEASLA